MKISILLPYKENFSSQYAGAVSLFVNDTTNYSKFKNEITIFGNTLYKKKLQKKYVNINLKSSLLESKSKNFVNEFIEYQKLKSSNIIEIHNRPNYVKLIKKNLSAKVILYFHNDPLKMNGSSSVDDRLYLLNNVDCLIFNSNWSKKRFFININVPESKINYHVIYQSTSKTKVNFKNKKKIISFVGKLNSAKGYDLFGKAVIKILNKYPKWSSVVFGDEPREKLLFKHKNLKIFGFKKHKYILNFLKKVSISVVCSRWDEPFGRTSLEAASRASAIIMSNKGGLPETTNHAIIINKLNVDTIYKAIENLILNSKERIILQKKAYKDFKFTHNYITNQIDKLRDTLNEIVIKSYPNNQSKTLKIVHITNFNERHNGRLQYNTGRRINNGLVRLGHNVLQISDRDVISVHKKLNDLTGTISLNDRIIQTCLNFKPDIVILGHADSVSRKTLIELKNKNKNTKFCQWFLDPVSLYGPDHIKNKKRILDKSDLLNASFLTTDPNELSFKISNSFFIPNPVDKSFETLENYKNTSPFDIFFAMSHGVHRGQLKSGKMDDREKIIENILLKEPSIKFDLYGMRNIQPIWGSEFIKRISQSNMGLNLSRGKPLKYYSSDRIVQLMGNGLLTFIDKRTLYSDFFTSKELITYSDISDLVEKILKYKKDDKLRRRIAKNGRDKYHKYFNSNLVAKYIIEKTYDIKSKSKFLWA